MASKMKIPEPPEWLKDYRLKFALIQVIDLAYDEKVSDKAVRLALIEASQDISELGKLAQG